MARSVATSATTLGWRGKRAPRLDERDDDSDGFKVSLPDETSATTLKTLRRSIIETEVARGRWLRQEILASTAKERNDVGHREKSARRNVTSEMTSYMAAKQRGETRIAR